MGASDLPCVIVTLMVEYHMVVLLVFVQGMWPLMFLFVFVILLLLFYLQSSFGCIRQLKRAGPVVFDDLNLN